MSKFQARLNQVQKLESEKGNRCENIIERLSETVQRMEGELHTIEFVLGLYEVGKTETIIQTHGVGVVSLQSNPFLNIEVEIKDKTIKTSEISHEVFTTCLVSGLRTRSATLHNQLREMSEVLTKI
jgi:hypothetical protein